MTDEDEILESYERGDWVTVPNLDAEKERYQEAARLSMKKDRRVNIRLSSHDIEPYSD